MKHRTILNPALLTAFTLLAGSAIALGVAIRINDIHLQKLPVPPPSPFHTLPKENTTWTALGPDDIASTEVLEALGTSNYLTRNYIETTPEPDQQPKIIQLHLAYYTGSIDTVPHVPERCFVGGGMRIVRTAVDPIPLDIERLPPDRTLSEETTQSLGIIRTGRTSKGVHVRMPAGVEHLKMNISEFADSKGNHIFAGYFFIANGGIAPTANDIRLLAFKLKDSYAYYAKVQITCPQAQTREQFIELATEFLDDMLPDIAARTPDWVKVTQGTYEPLNNNASNQPG